MVGPFGKNVADVQEPPLFQILAPFSNLINQEANSRFHKFSP
jgi:hypothetical protein